MKTLVRIVAVALTVFYIPHIVSGVSVDGFSTALIFALVLGVANVVVRPIFVLLTLPLTLLSLGLFLFVINTLIFLFVASLVSGVSVVGFVPAFLAALLVSVVSWITHKLF